MDLLPRRTRLGPRGASEFLRNMGVPGVQYWDGASRSGEAGTRNYVVFDDKLPKILKME